MSLTDRIVDLMTAVSSKMNTLSNRIGNLTSLATTEKGSLVGAVNELSSQIGGSSAINDAATALDSTWSSSKTNSEIVLKFNSLTAGAPANLDTWLEITGLMETNEYGLAGVVTGLNNRVRFDINNQGLTGIQQGNAIANIGGILASDVGDTSRDFATEFNVLLNF